MSLKRTKGRLFFFMILAVFFMLGGPALAEERAETLSAPSATLRAKSYIYSGEVQYVTLDALSHPLEEKGHYSFAWYKNGKLLPSASGALPIRFVSDTGLYYCKVTFIYNGETTETVTDSVEIVMRKKTVEIPAISPLVYTGYHQFPQIYESAEYRVVENSGALAAGRYFVTLELKDSENCAFPSVEGAELSADGTRLVVPYTVDRAENLFSTPPSVPACYEGEMPAPQAFAKFGKVHFRYFSDADTACEIPPPTHTGVYFVRATVDGDANVLPLESAPLRFEILPLTVSALRMLSPPARLSYEAFETLEAEGLSLVATMADGSTRAVENGSLSVLYPIGGNRLHARDTYVLLSYGGAVLPLAVSVRRVPLDLSSVTWSTEGWVYDGVERELQVTGLPNGVSVSGYRGNRITNAGLYTVTAALSFDRENYEGPDSISYTLSVERQAVRLPVIPAAVYNGTILSPMVRPSALYVAEDLPRVVHAGVYATSLRLTDPQNYRFEGVAADVAEIPFEVLPMELRVVIDTVELYLGDRFAMPSYRVIAGVPLEGDDLGLRVREVDGTFEYYFENPDYKVTYEGGQVERIYRLPRAAESAVFLGLTAVILIVLGIFCLILLYRKRIRSFEGGAVSTAEPRCTYPLYTRRDEPRIASSEKEYRLTEQAPPVACPETNVTEEAEDMEETEEAAKETEEDASAAQTCVDAVDVSTADALITDALAEALVMAEERVIYTEGSRHGVINVDTLSAAFAPGEEVDINRLKKKKLIAKDVGYLKVLARGSIDKPLTVYADDFSLGAIKMIALTGGRTFHVKSRPMP